MFATDLYSLVELIIQKNENLAEDTRNPLTN
ncbi:MAG: hypothetical protein RLZZ04_1672 [Cyanobacteriota bacterium]|jgi:hypothetical protein